MKPTQRNSVAIMDEAPKLSVAGFTLLELILAITLTAMMVTLIAGGFRIGLDAWEKAEAGIAQQQRTRVVAQRIQRNLASAVPDTLEMAEQHDLPVGGDEKKLTLFSNYAIGAKHSAPPVYTRYRIDTDPDDRDGLRLVVSELSWSQGWMDEKVREDAPEITLLQGVDKISFAYLKPEDDGPSWTDEWQPEDLKPWMPIAVKITFHKTATDEEPWEIIATAHASTDERQLIEADPDEN